MSISLNNHENRISALENKKLEWVDLAKTEVCIPNNTWVKVCDFDKNVFKFGMIAVNNSFQVANPKSSTTYLNFLPLANHAISFIPWQTDPYVSTMEVIEIKVYDGTIYGRTISNMGPEHDNYVTICWGLKLYYNFSYNIYHLICTFLEFLIEEV